MLLQKLPDIRPRRIISLVPSQTELLHYLGLEDEVIGITKFCIHPDKWFRSKERVGGTKAINVEKIIALQPDLVIANKEENVKEQIEALGEIPVWVTDVNDFNEALVMMGDIGSLTHTKSRADELISNIVKSFEALRSGFLPQRVAYLIWKDPYMTIGGDTFINSMLELAGFKNVFASQKRYPEITIRQLGLMQCDAIFLSSEPYPFSEKHIAQIQEQLPGTSIILVDGEMFSWYGSHMLQAATYFKSLSMQLQ